MALNEGLVAVTVSRSAGWFRVITCRALIRLTHESSTLYFRLQYLSLVL
jgi:hypothetical protein